MFGFGSALQRSANRRMLRGVLVACGVISLACMLGCTAENTSKSQSKSDTRNLTQVEWANWLVAIGARGDSYMQAYKLMIVHPDLRRLIRRDAGYEQVEDFVSTVLKTRRRDYQQRFLRELRGLFRVHHRSNLGADRPPKLILHPYGDEKENLLRIVYSGSNNAEELYQVSGWHHYTVNPKLDDWEALNDIKNPPKLYVTFSDILQQLSADAFETLLETLLNAGFRGEVKVPQGYDRVLSSFDHLVLHGRSDKDIAIGKDSVLQVFGSDLRLSTGIDLSVDTADYPEQCKPTGEAGIPKIGTVRTSFNSFLASEVCKRLVEHGDGCEESPAITLPQHGELR